MLEPRASFVARTAVVVAVVAVAMSLASAPGAQAKTCRNVFGGDAVSATNVGCAKARRIVRTWAVRFRRDGVVNRKVLGFSVRVRASQVEGEVGFARRGRARVRWYVNVPPRGSSARAATAAR